MIYAGVGSRSTPPDAQTHMIELGEIFAKAGWALRSGGAKGADQAFERGCDNGKGDKEIFRHYHSTPHFENVARQYHPNWHACSPFIRQLMGRNVMIVLGDKPDQVNQPRYFVFWSENLERGGTSHSYRIARAYGVTAINLAVQRNWRPKL